MSALSIRCLVSLPVIDNCSHGRVDRTAVSGALVSGLIPSRVKPTSIKLVFTASLLLENKPVNLLVVPLKKTLRGIPAS